MAKPKLALIPAAQGSKLYSVLPADGVGDFDFSRNTIATRINSQGLIETVASGVSRLNYPLIDGVVNGCPSHLLEPQSTNLITQSELFSDASWGKIATIVGANSIISADGTQNASLIQSTQTGSAYVAPNNLTLTIGNTYTFSCFAKKGNNDWIRLAHITSGGTGCWFDLENGVVGTVNSQSATIEDYGNGWYRCTNTFIATDDANLDNAFIGICDANGSTSVGIVGKNDYLWGAQVEQGSYATSYIPTSGTTVTRSAETANGAGNASTFNSSEGVLMYQIKPISLEGTHKRITLSDGTSTNRIIMGFDNSNNVSATVYNGSNQAILGGNYIGKDEMSKYALKYKESDFALWLNGFEVNSETSGGVTYPIGTLSQFRFEDGTGGLDFYGSAKQIQYFDSALNDSDLEKLTSWTSFTDLANGQTYSIK